MSLIIEFFDSGECDKCQKKIANVHLRTTSRHWAERQNIGVCFKCWRELTKKVNQEFANYQTIEEEVKQL